MVYSLRTTWLVTYSPGILNIKSNFADYMALVASNGGNPTKP